MTQPDLTVTFYPHSKHDLVHAALRLQQRGLKHVSRLRDLKANTFRVLHPRNQLPALQWIEPVELTDED